MKELTSLRLGDVKMYGDILVTVENVITPDSYTNFDEIKKNIKVNIVYFDNLTLVRKEVSILELSDVNKEITELKNITKDSKFILEVINTNNKPYLMALEFKVNLNSVEVSLYPIIQLYLNEMVWSNKQEIKDIEKLKCFDAIRVYDYFEPNSKEAFHFLIINLEYLTYNKITSYLEECLGTTDFKIIQTIY